MGFDKIQNTNNVFNEHVLLHPFCRCQRGFFVGEGVLGHVCGLESYGLQKIVFCLCWLKRTIWKQSGIESKCWTVAFVNTSWKMIYHLLKNCFVDWMAKHFFFIAVWFRSLRCEFLAQPMTFILGSDYLFVLRGVLYSPSCDFKTWWKTFSRTQREGIDLHCFVFIQYSTIDVIVHSSNNLLLCSVVERKSYGFEIKRWWVISFLGGLPF